jgi:hypothetical protein
MGVRIDCLSEYDTPQCLELISSSSNYAMR